MAWWRARVVAPARRAWLAVVVVAARVRRRKARTAERAGIVDLHRDVETCGYHDVQVMWDMLGLDTGPPHSSAPPLERRKRSPFWTWTPSFWHFGSSRRTATAAAS